MSTTVPPTHAKTYSPKKLKHTNLSKLPGSSGNPQAVWQSKNHQQDFFGQDMPDSDLDDQAGMVNVSRQPDFTKAVYAFLKIEAQNLIKK
ncbi:MAG: hypothetical protein SPF59_06950 [Oscillospiraceae bacterium]|nr:hypothetical protein [Oscillospiraceae bacterium]